MAGGAKDRASPVTSPIAPGSFVGHYRGWLGFFRLDRQISERTGKNVFFRSSCTSLAARLSSTATRELTGRSKTRNGDDRPSGPESWRLGRRVPPEPGSGDGKTVANSGQMGLLVEAKCYLPLNNG